MMWNQRSLCPPPTNSFKVTLTFQLKEKLLLAQKQIRGGNPVLSNHLAVLKSEQYVQDRLIYKLSSQFRSEKSMKNLKQARVCLNRLKETDIQRQLIEMTEAFDVNIVEEDESEAYLPSRQMLQYYLVRLMSTAALLSRTCQVMEVGNMLPANTLMIAMAARLWVTCKSLRSYVCHWYQALFPLLEYLQATPIPWLKSEGTDLVDQLPTFLFDWLQSQFGMDVSLVEDSVISKTGQVDLQNSVVEGKIDVRTESVTTGITEDIGVPIQRKRKEPVNHSDQTLVTKHAKTTDDMQNTVKPFMKNINTHIVESANNQNELGENKPSKKENQTVYADVTDKKKLRKCLRKKLKSMSDIVKCLRNIQDSDILNVGKYELVITETLKEKCKEMLATCTKHGDVREVEASDFDNYSEQMLKKKLIVKLLKLDRQKRPQVSKQKISGVSSETDADNQQDDIEKGLSQHQSADYPQFKTKFEEKLKKVKQKKKVKGKKKEKKTNVKDAIRINELNEIAKTNIGLPQDIADNGKNALKVGKVKKQEKGEEKRIGDKSRDTILETVSEFGLQTKETKWKRKRKADADGDLKDTVKTNVISSKLKRKQEDSVTEPKNKRAKLSADAISEYKDRTIQNTSKLETVGKASNNIDEHKLETRKVKKKNKHKQAKLHKPNNKAKVFENRNVPAMTKDTSVRQLKQNYKKSKKRKN